MSSSRKVLGKLTASGIASGLCYAGLFAYEIEIMATFTRTDGLYPLLPVAAALVFSFAHGAFTAYFWELVGIRARLSLRRTSGQIAE